MIGILKKQHGMNIVGQGGKIILFIGAEEKHLTEAFGKAYEDYVANVDRMVPWRKPGPRS